MPQPYTLHGTIYATSQTRLRARDQYTSSTVIGGKGGVGPSTLHTTLEGPKEYVMQDGCRVHVDSYMASNRSCFMVTWNIFKNHILEVDLTHNQGGPWHSERSQPFICSIVSYVRTCMN